MSRTDKDVPYWVRLNNEGTSTDHHHLRFGKEITKRIYLFDENDEPIMVEEPVYRSAHNIAVYDDLYFSKYNTPPLNWMYRNAAYTMYKRDDGRYTEPIMRRAHELVAAGRGRELVQIGTVRRQAVEVVVTGYVKDYCTEGEPIPNKDWAWGQKGENPCTPALDGPGWYHYGSTSQRAYEHELFYTKERTNGRKFQKRWAKEWNSGADLEDWDEDDHLTNTTHSYYYW